MKRIFQSSLFRIAGIYTLSNFINAAMPFFLMPILTRYLTPTDYGITALFSVLIGLCAPFIGLSIQGAVFVKCFKKDEVDFPKYVSSCIMVLIVNCAIITAISSVFYDYIENASKFPGEWLWTVIIVCVSQFVISIWLAILRSQMKSFFYAVMQVTQTLLNIGLTILLVICLHMNWQGRIIAQIVAAVFLGIISIFLLKRNHYIVFKYDFKYIKDALKFGVPLIPHTLAGFAMTMADRFIIIDLSGLSDAGIYSVGAQFAMIIGFITTSFNQAFSPWLYNKLNNATDYLKSKIVLMTYVYMIVIVTIVFIISYLLPIVFSLLIGPQFYEAIHVFFWIALAHAFNGMYFMVVNYIFYVQKTYILAWITFVTSMIHLILCYVLVQKNGLEGAGQATAISHFVTLLFVWLLSNKVYPMPWLNFYRSFLKGDNKIAP